MLVSGEQETLDLVMPLLRKFCRAIYMLGAPSLATRMKLINNLVLGTYMAVLAEAVSWGEIAGLDRAKVLDILANGAGNSGVLNAKKEKLLNLDFSPHFSASAIEKDLRYLQEMADETGKDFSVGTCVWKAFQETCARGLQKEDFSAVYKVMRG